MDVKHLIQELSKLDGDALVMMDTERGLVDVDYITVQENVIWFS